MSAATPSPATWAYPLAHRKHETSGNRGEGIGDNPDEAPVTTTTFYGSAHTAAQQGYSNGLRPLGMGYPHAYSCGAAGVMHHVPTAAGGGGSSSHPSAFHSLEMLSNVQSPLSQPDFYVAAAAAAAQMDKYHHCSSSSRYPESIPTQTDVHSAGVDAFSPVMGYGSAASLAAMSGYGCMDPNGVSVISNGSLSSSRFPQWYLPRGFCPVSYSNVMGSSGYSGFGCHGDCTSAGITPATLSMMPATTEEDMLSSSDGQSRYTFIPPPPPPPRFLPQPNPDFVHPFTLPPSSLVSSTRDGAPAAAISSRVLESPSSVSSSGNFPHFKAPRAPQFVPYDGRAYGIPAYKTRISSTDAVAAVARSPLVGALQGSHYRLVEATSPIHVTARRSGTEHCVHQCPCVESTHPLSAVLSTSRVCLDDARAVSERASKVCSPEESALLADVHARLLRQHRSLQIVKARLSAHRSAPRPLSRGSATASVKLSTPRSQVVAMSPQRDAASPAMAAAEEAAVAVLSPIPRPPAADTSTADISLCSMWEGSEEAARAPTQDELDRILTMPGVVWRHDPYSLHVLPHPQATVASDGSEVSSPSCAALPSCSKTAGAASGGYGHRGSMVNVTQLPRSPDHSLCTHASSSGCANVLRPSARRLPTKKVCVRHYVSSDGDPSPSHDTNRMVGALLSVREVPNLTAPASTYTSRAFQPRCNSAFGGDDNDGGGVLAVRQETSPTAVSAAPGLDVAHLESGTSPLPKPRSKQMSLPAPLVGARAGVTTTHTATSNVSSVSSPPGPLEASHASASASASASSSSAAAAAAAALDARVPSGAPDQQDESTPLNGDNATADSPAALTKIWPPVRRASPQASSLDLSATCSTCRQGSRWSWRQCSARVYPPAVSEGMGMTKAGHRVASLADLDTSNLSDLWQKLESSGCFRDALERRRRVIGIECNSSTRVVRRVVPLARRLVNRRRGLEGDRDDGPRFTVLAESEMKYVCLLQHRFRQSTAVSADYYAPGTMVVVDGDMGVDCGVVQFSVTRGEYDVMTDSQRRAANFVVHLEFPLASSIHRATRADEVVMLSDTKLHLEEATLEFLQSLVSQPHLFQSCRIECMRFVDVEFQADGQKLYVHYTCSTPVRFLELATFLNHIFHCRIWMKVARMDEL